jgi:peptidoglycan-associated lipoprotein
MTNYPFRPLRPNQAVLTLTMVMVLIASACGGKHTPVPPPPPPAPAAGSTNAPSGGSGRPVIAEFSVEPSSIQPGQSAVLRWNVTGSTNVAIDHGLGTVPSSGTSRVTPANTTTYLLIASGTAGDTTANATVTVTGPPAPPPPARNISGNIGTIDKRVADLRDVLFDYDSNNIRDDARAALTGDADALKRIFADFPNASINVEGHCDERGSAEYNLGLGDRRATSARDFLSQLGVPADRLKTISYGKERPVCTESDESCWQRNRRAHFSVGQ